MVMGVVDCGLVGLKVVLVSRETFSFTTFIHKNLLLFTVIDTCYNIYTCLTLVLHLSYTCLTLVLHLSYTCQHLYNKKPR
eukprot:SAG22_NODE_12957_length_423_cov_1.617284_1_plen_79_part_10